MFYKYAIGRINGPLKEGVLLDSKL